MFGSRNRTLVTVTVVIEATLAGWVLGHGRLALLLMVVAVTACDTLWGCCGAARPATLPDWSWRWRWVCWWRCGRTPR
jgi:hypothetical protein